MRCASDVACRYLSDAAAADCPQRDRATAASKKPMARNADEILTDVLRSIGHSLEFQGRPNFWISVNKGPGKEHCSRTLRLNFSNVAVRYTNAGAITAVIGREPHTGFQQEATYGISRGA